MLRFSRWRLTLLQNGKRFVIRRVNVSEHGGCAKKSRPKWFKLLFPHRDLFPHGAIKIETKMLKEWSHRDELWPTQHHFHRELWTKESLRCCAVQTIRTATARWNPTHTRSASCRYVKFIYVFFLWFLSYLPPFLSISFQPLCPITTSEYVWQTACLKDPARKCRPRFFFLTLPSGKNIIFRRLLFIPTHPTYPDFLD